MKRIFIILSLIFSVMALMSAQEIRRLGNTWNFPKNETAEDTTLVNMESTSSYTIRHDTIVVQELIKRTDVIHRTEEVVKRVESTPYDDRLRHHEIDIMEYVDVNNIDDIQDNAPISGEEQNITNSFVEFEAPSGGNYIWVPDSMENIVMGILRGKKPMIAVKESQEDEVDKNEMVTFRGKTLPMVLKDRNLGRYDRGLFNYLFIPRGVWQIGLTASYGEFSTSDLQILDLVSDIDFNGKIWSIRPYFSYFLRSNLSLGLRLGYTKGEANVGSFNVDIDEDMSFNLHDITYRSENYSASITFTQYLGIARRGRFGVFNEVELALAGGKADFHRPFNGEMRRTHTDTYSAALNFSPGVCVFVLDQVSFNVSLGVFGLNLKHEKQKVNDEEMGWRTTSGANFRFNIFNINFGLAVSI